MKKFFLIGYYGKNNLGDEMLLESILKIFDDLNFDGKLYILSDKINISKNYDFKIFNVEKYDFLNLINTIKNTDVLIFGGGNLLQSETSLRSFLYYDFLIKIAKHYKKDIIFLSQGFGHFKHKFATKELTKILKYKNLYGILRDKSSYLFSKRYSQNLELGVDIGMLKYNGYSFKKDSQKEHISIIMKHKKDWKKIIYLLKQMNIKRITPIVFNKSQDSIIAYEFFENHKNEINITFPITDERNIIDEILKSEFVISDRLHGGLLSLYLGVPVIMYKNQKNYRVFKTIDKNYNLFYYTEDDLIDSLSNIYNYNFISTGKNFRKQLMETYINSKKLIKTFL
jgi:polysaccharide pyruvyl transferase CsaB